VDLCRSSTPALPPRHERHPPTALWPLPPGAKPIEVVLDGAVEIGFANDTDMARFVEASPILFGDEINCFGWDAAFFLPEGSRTYVDNQADGTPNGPDKLHRLHVYMNGALDDAFRAWACGFAETSAAHPAVRKLRLHLPQPFDNANPQPPSPVDHRVPDDMAIIFGRADLHGQCLGTVQGIHGRKFQGLLHQHPEGQDCRGIHELRLALGRQAGDADAIRGVRRTARHALGQPGPGAGEQLVHGFRRGHQTGMAVSFSSVKETSVLLDGCARVAPGEVVL